MLNRIRIANLQDELPDLLSMILSYSNIAGNIALSHTKLPNFIKCVLKKYVVEKCMMFVRGAGEGGGGSCF